MDEDFARLGCCPTHLAGSKLARKIFILCMASPNSRVVISSGSSEPEREASARAARLRDENALSMYAVLNPETNRWLSTLGAGGRPVGSDGADPSTVPPRLREGCAAGAADAARGTRSRPMGAAAAAGNGGRARNAGEDSRSNHMEAEEAVARAEEPEEPLRNSGGEEAAGEAAGPE